eukprot:13135217-Heterocapsa_arctica.AAC.1
MAHELLLPFLLSIRPPPGLEPPRYNLEGIVAARAVQLLDRATLFHVEANEAARVAKETARAAKEADAIADTAIEVYDMVVMGADWGICD